MSRVRQFLFPVMTLVLMLTACSDEAATSSSLTTEAVAPSTSAPTTQVSSTTASDSDDGFTADYAALIATIESAMEGTSYAGAALEDPEVFIATAELFCDLLSEGMTEDQLLAEYLVRLSDDGAVEVDEDDGLMAGVLLGATIEIVCPQEAEATS